MDRDDVTSNPRAATAPVLNEVVDSLLTRRAVVRGGAAAAALSVFSGLRPSPTSIAHAAETTSLLGFESVAATVADTVTVPTGYSWQAIARWGDPIVPSGPAWIPDASNSAADQEQQLGMGHDGMVFFPRTGGNSRRGWLVLNHETSTPNTLFPDGKDGWVPEKTAKDKAAHGLSVIEVYRKKDGTWIIRDSPQSRRITPETRMAISGPAAGHPLLDAEGSEGGTRVDGTVNNCSSGKTPWGTYVTCEENFDGYFRVGLEGELDAPEGHEELFARYGVKGTGDRRWGRHDDRWRADLHPKRVNGFGWCVEIDPRDPDAMPVKRTALGRFKHEGIAFTFGRGGRVVAYMGDDQQFDYYYKYVSSRAWKTQRSEGISPLDEGELWVARFDADGTGDWLPLVWGQGPLTPENGFADQGEVLVKTRLAADLLGATPMDRPEWTTVDPRTKDVYLSLTNNNRRGTADAANPRIENRDGHVLRLSPHRADHVRRTFTWDVFLVGGDGTPDVSDVDGAPLPVPPPEAAFGSPDGLAFDKAGRLWIQTDGDQPVTCNNQMLAADPAAGDVRRFLVGPPGCEVTGFTQTPDQKTVFVNIQHPGGYGGPTPLTSSFPDGALPRPCTIVITKDDGGIIGT